MADSSPIREFVVATRELQGIRTEHAPAIKACRDAKTGAQLRLEASMRAHNVTCIPVGDQWARMKTNRSVRAITDGIIHEALDDVPDDILMGDSVDDAADAVASHVQRRRTVHRPYVAFDTVPQRGCAPVECPPIITEAAEAYARSMETLEAARAELKTAVGDRPARMRDHQAAVMAWFGTDESSQKVTLGLSGGGESTVFVRRKESKRKPRITTEMIGDLTRKALRRARKGAVNAREVRIALVDELVRRIGSLPRETTSMVTLDRGRNPN